MNLPRVATRLAASCVAGLIALTLAPAASATAAAADILPSTPQRWAPSDATPLIPSDVQIVRGPDILRTDTWTAGSGSYYPFASIWCTTAQGYLTSYWVDTNLSLDDFALSQVDGSGDRLSLSFRPLDDSAPLPAGAYLTLNGTCSTKTATSSSSWPETLPLSERLWEMGDNPRREFEVSPGGNVTVSLVCPARMTAAGYGIHWEPGAGAVTSLNYTKNGLSFTATSHAGTQSGVAMLNCGVDVVRQHSRPDGVVTATAGKPVIVDVLANDSVLDVADRPGRVTPYSTPPDVNVTVTADRKLAITADASLVGTTQRVRYRLDSYLSDIASPGSNEWAESYVDVTVVAAPSPSAFTADDAATVPVGQTAQVDVLANDTYTGSAAVTIVRAPSALNAKVVGNKIEVTPASAAAGSTHIVEYALTDSNGTTAPGELAVTVPATPAPAASANDDMGKSMAGQQTLIDLLDNDSYYGDLSEITLEIVSANPALHASITDDHRLRVAPDESLAGTTQTVQYRLTDVDGSTATANVAVEVAPLAGPVTPGPTTPDPTKPDPPRPGPTKPGPTKPGPTKPGPTKPGPTKPGPTKPGPTKPGPTIDKLPVTGTTIEPRVLLGIGVASLLLAAGAYTSRRRLND